MSQAISRRPGDTEPIQMMVSAKDLADLTQAVSILAYFIKEDEPDDFHVAGVPCSIVSGLMIQLDPVNAKNGGGIAFQEEALYIGHVVITMSDGDVQGYPQDARNDVRINVR